MADICCFVSCVCGIDIDFGENGHGGVNSNLAAAIRTIVVLAFVLLHEDLTAKSASGCLLIGAGTLMMVL